MFTLSIFRRQVERGSNRRQRARRSPVVEGLEGRQLLSGIVGNHIGTSAMIQGNHIGASASPAIVGQHIGTGVSPAIVGNHIGMAPAIQGAHIG